MNITDPDDVSPHDICTGDKIEFSSDLQTEKGPSAGSCIFSDGHSVAIRHSDCVEWFDPVDIEVKRITTSHDGKKLWILK